MKEGSNDSPKIDNMRNEDDLNLIVKGQQKLKSLKGKIRWEGDLNEMRGH